MSDVADRMKEIRDEIINCDTRIEALKTFDKEWEKNPVDLPTGNRREINFVTSSIKRLEKHKKALQKEYSLLTYR